MFFKKLIELNPELDISIRCKSKDGRIAVTVLPTTDNKINPIIVTGTPEELDEQFFSVISEPIKATRTFIENTAEYKKQLKELEDANKKKLEDKKKDADKKKDSDKKGGKKELSDKEKKEKEKEEADKKREEEERERAPKLF